MNFNRYNFSYWQPDPEIIMINQPGVYNTITSVMPVGQQPGCGYFSNPQDPANSAYYDANGNYYNNIGFSTWEYYHDGGGYIYSPYSLPNYCPPPTPQNPFYTSNNQFKLFNETSPSSFNDYPEIQFTYIPHLSVDRTIENGIGTSLEIYSLNLTYIYVSKFGRYESSESLIRNTFQSYYNSVTDKTIYRPVDPLIFSWYFDSILFVLTYSTNAGDIVRHQVVKAYNNTGDYAFPTQWTGNSEQHFFYLPLYNDTLKYIDTVSSNLYNVSYNSLTGLVNAYVSGLSPQEFYVSINYTTSTRVNQVATLNIPDGNSSSTCGNANFSFGGYVGTAQYDIQASNTDTGLLDFYYMNYSLPDRYRLSANSQVIYDTLGYRGHGNKIHIPISQPITNGVVSLQIDTYDPSTAWIFSVDCIKPYTTYTNGNTFDFNNEYSKDDILVLTNGVYVVAKEGTHYQFHSTISPTVTRYTSLSNIAIYSKNERIIGKVKTVTMYNDPYTGLPVKHLQVELAYPNKVVVGSNQSAPNDGDIRITQLSLRGSFVEYKINIGTDSLDKYIPYRIIPGMTGRCPVTMLGRVEYAKDSQTLNEVLLIRNYSDETIPLLDPLSVAVRSDYYPSTQFKYADSTTATQILPQTNPTSGFGFYFEDTAVNNTITLPFAQPFYGNTVGDKLFCTTITTDVQPGAVLGTFKVNVVDGVTSYSTTIQNITANTPLVCTRYNGYTTNSMSVEISNCNREAFFMARYVEAIVADLLSTQSYPIPSSSYTILKKNLSYGDYAYTIAQNGVDYSISGSNIVSINPITISTRVITNPLL